MTKRELSTESPTNSKRQKLSNTININDTFLSVIEFGEEICGIMADECKLNGSTIYTKPAYGYWKGHIKYYDEICSKRAKIHLSSMSHSTNITYLDATQIKYICIITGKLLDAAYDEVEFLRLMELHVKGGINSIPNSVNKQFKYHNSTGETYNDYIPIVTKVQFDIGRFGKRKHCIEFEEEVTINEAITEVEQYLSQPITSEYYANIKDDTFHELEFDAAFKQFRTRGACLTDAYFLEHLYIDPQGILILTTGS